MASPLQLSPNLPLPPHLAEKFRSSLRQSEHLIPETRKLDTPILTPYTHLLSSTMSVLRTSATPVTATKQSAITFRHMLEVIICYAHVLDPERLAPIWFELAAVKIYKFHPTLEDALSSLLPLNSPRMKICSLKRSCGTTFFREMCDHQCRNPPNLFPLIVSPRQVDWLTAEAADKGLTELLSTLWSETNLLVAYLISLVNCNEMKRRTCIDCVAEYNMINIHLLLHLSLYLDTWYISFDEVVVSIDLLSIATIHFELIRRTLNRPHMGSSAALAPVTPAPSKSPPKQAPITAPLPAPATPHATRGRKSLWTPPVGILIPQGTGLRSCISS